MKIAGNLMTRFASAGLALILSGTPVFAQQPGSDPQPAVSPESQTQAPDSGSGVQQNSGTQPATSQSEFPDSPGATQVPAPSTQNAASPVTQTTRPATKPRPVGTAAAEITETGGVAASQPAGVAIAPAKQRRTRSLLIKVGALVGAGVAIGTVYALSSATSSKPPGAH